MREIKFRGMTLGGDWVYGNLSHIIKPIRSYKHVEPGYYISNKAGMPFAYHVRPETVGQYTGLKDENEAEIYEGDVVECNRYENNELHIVQVEDIRNLPPYLFGSNLNSRTVIGSIHTNPKLLTA